MYSYRNTDHVYVLAELEKFRTKIFPTYTVADLEIRKEIEAWQSQVEDFLTISIQPTPKILVDVLWHDEYSIFRDFKSRAQSSNTEEYFLLSINDTINLVSNNIKNVSDYILMCNSLRGEELYKVNGTQDKLDFLLEKLSIPNTIKYFSVKTILELNDISYRPEDPAEIALILSKKEYVTKKSNDDREDDVRITIKGAAYIERKLKSKLKQNASKKSDAALNDKLDEMLLRLKKLGFGQEIIFEEIEEMREQIGKLSKKNWSQLLKGKLMDLAVAQVINKDVASDIYRNLTDNYLTLLK